MKTMLREDLLDIYRKISDKRLQEGCYIYSNKTRREFYHNGWGVITEVKDTDWGKFEGIPNIGPCYWSESVPDDNYWHSVGFDTGELMGNFEIVGSRIYIGDVIDWMIESNNIERGLFFLLKEYKKMMFLWTKMRDPIEDQDQECIDFIRSLI